MAYIRATVSILGCLAVDHEFLDEYRDVPEVFLIQNTQNRDSKAINLKLDEMIRSSHHAENELIDIEKLSDGDLEQLEKRYERIRQEYDERKHCQRGDMRDL